MTWLVSEEYKTSFQKKNKNKNPRIPYLRDKAAQNLYTDEKNIRWAKRPQVNFLEQNPVTLNWKKRRRCVCPRLPG